MSAVRPSTKPFTIRLTDAERAELERRAGEMALGSYLKLMLFAAGDRTKRRGARAPVKDHVLLGQLLALLGESRIAESLENLAEAVNSGVLVWDDQSPEIIHQVCSDIVAMRLMLMKALGFQIDDAELEETLSQTFGRAASTEGRTDS